MTVGDLLQEHGYRSVCIGKWHLGLGWQYSENDPESVDFSKSIRNGPVLLGFDYFYGITASLDIPPYVYIENDRSTTVPVKYTESKSRYGWWRKGLTGDGFEHEQVLPHLTEKTVAFIDQHMERRSAQPFFIYFALPAPHTPILPTEDFKGKSGTNPYGDFVLQVDWTVGRVLEALDRHGIAENTIVIFTADNGCSPQARYEELAEFGHNPSYLFRGHKADIFEGGHRVPFIVRWPSKVRPGTTTDQTICLTDLMATCAAVFGARIPESAGEDSYNMLPVMIGEARRPVREATVHHSVNGSFSIRKGRWKLILCPGSGGWSHPKPQEATEAGLPPLQLYDLETDIGEEINIWEKHPAVVDELKALLIKYILTGRSTPGEDQDYVHPEYWPGLAWMDEQDK
jgi:arylsulfatase A-like enzyme